MKNRIPSHIRKLFKKGKNELIKIDVGCGNNKAPGFIGVDYRRVPGVDIVQDLELFPWPIPDNCGTLIMCAHVVEHINPSKLGFINFMDECWRILKVGGQMMISTPYAGSRGYFSDPTHVNPCTIETWGYFDPLHPLKVYNIYEPKPWKIVQSHYRMDGNMEILLQKRALAKVYKDEPEPQRDSEVMYEKK